MEPWELWWHHLYQSPVREHLAPRHCFIWEVSLCHLCGFNYNDSFWNIKILIYIILTTFSADGRFEGSLMTKVIVRYNGMITWKPPASYKSACTMDVTFFPFDRQNCPMKFGSWTYDGNMVKLVLINQQVDRSDFLIMASGRFSAPLGSKAVDETATSPTPTSHTHSSWNVFLSSTHSSSLFPAWACPS